MEGKFDAESRSHSGGKFVASVAGNMGRKVFRARVAGTARGVFRFVRSRVAWQGEEDLRNEFRLSSRKSLPPDCPNALLLALAETLFPDTVPTLEVPCGLYADLLPPAPIRY